MLTTEGNDSIVLSNVRGISLLQVSHPSNHDAVQPSQDGGLDEAPSSSGKCGEVEQFSFARDEKYLKKDTRAFLQSLKKLNKVTSSHIKKHKSLIDLMSQEDVGEIMQCCENWLDHIKGNPNGRLRGLRENIVLLAISIRYLTSGQWTDAFLETVATCAYQHNQIPLVLDFAAESPSVFGSSATTLEFSMREIVPEVLRVKCPDHVSEQLFDAIIMKLVWPELKHATNERYRAWVIETPRRAVFNQLANGTYRWQKIVPMTPRGNNEDGHDAYLADLSDLIFHY
ncbi:MAG: hypothetical protein SGCHY_005027, partial [Lobulomycetales sp.]